MSALLRTFPPGLKDQILECHYCGISVFWEALLDLGSVNVALKNEIGRNKCEILAQKKYKSTTATNPTVLQASRKVAKLGDAGQDIAVTAGID